MCFEERSVECELLFMNLVCIFIHLENGICAALRTISLIKLSLTYFTVIYKCVSNFYQTFSCYPSVCIGPVTDYVFVIRGILFSAFH
jgi:hypothetical protein